jgi:septum formation protein
MLEKVRIPFRVVKPEMDEAGLMRDASPGIAAVIAGKKVAGAADVLKGESPRWILGADTIVEIDGRLLGKPADGAEALEFLRLLSGRVHRVHTGLALLADVRGPLATKMCSTEVKFKQLTDGEIDFYQRSNEWSGAAGAYRIQEQGGFFVEWVKGSYSNVVGLPLETLYVMLNEQKYRFF